MDYYATVKYIGLFDVTPLHCRSSLALQPERTPDRTRPIEQCEPSWRHFWPRMPPVRRPQPPQILPLSVRV
jgi:hypothetical protein